MLLSLPYIKTWRFNFSMNTNLITQLNEQKRKVDFNSYDISVKELISMVEDDIIDIAPEYQRQFRWKEDRQSMLIKIYSFGYSHT